MAVFPANFTQRVWLDYEGNSGQHSTMFRYRDEIPQSTCLANTADIAAIMTQLWFDDVTVTGLRYSAKGSNFSVPEVPAGPITGTQAGTLAGEDYPRFFSMIGRGIDGRRVRWYFWETIIQVDDDYRRPLAPSAPLIQLWTYLQDFAHGITNVNSQQINVYQYVNLGYNAYKQRKRRITG